MRSRLYKEFYFLLPALLAVMVVFYHHLLGDKTFPWDFQGSYFTHAVSRMRDGSFLSPPLWMPWGGFGIPAHQSLQDGAWYLPQYVFDFLGWTYDIIGATRLQVVHVFVGAVGIFAFLRFSDSSRVAASLGALCFVFDPAFYSNSQHVDIVRGTSMMPWLLFTLGLLFRKPGAWSFIAFCLVLWQFLVGAYPGLIVSGAYACTLISLFEAIRAKRDHRTLPAFALVALAVVIAAGLAMVKFLPALADATNMRESTGQDAALMPELLTTLILDFDLAGMPNDLTMRDLFIALPVLWLSVIGAACSRAPLIAYALFALGLIPMIGQTNVQSLVDLLPLMDLSRFHLSDFRPILHMALLLFAAVGYDAYARADKGHVSCRRLTIGAFSGALLILALSVAGWRQGQPLGAFAWLSISALCTFAAFAIWHTARLGERVRPALTAFFMLAAIAVSGFGHVSRSERVWQAERSDALEIMLYGSTVRELLATAKRTSVEYRPERDIVGEWPQSYAALYDQRYNFAWLAQGYAAFGYENRAASKWIADVYAAVISGNDSDTASAVRWMIERSSSLLLADMTQFDAKSLADCRIECKSASVAASASTKMLAFRDNGAVYDVSTTSPIVMIENEPYYPGWSSKICRGEEACFDAGDASSAIGVLRSWSLPAGHYRFVTYYSPPAWRVATIIAQVSAILAIFLFFLMLFASRRRSHRANSVSTSVH